jgi:hypothetical protein
MKTEKQLHLDQAGQALHALSMPELRERFAECYGYKTTSRQKRHLVNRILWAVQRDAFGDISDAARNKALAISDDRDVRERFPRHRPVPDGNPTLTVAYRPKEELLPGTVLRRSYQGTDVRVLVLESGFEWKGRHFKSLSAVARAVTGTRWNGRLFFGLTKGGAQ